MDGEAGWWTTSGNIGLPPLARVMGVGRQQHGNNEMYKQYLLMQLQCTCKFEKIQEDDILKIINKMDNKCSSGYDMFLIKL